MYLVTNEDHAGVIRGANDLKSLKSSLRVLCMQMFDADKVVLGDLEDSVTERLLNRVLKYETVWVNINFVVKGDDEDEWDSEQVQIQYTSNVVSYDE